MTQAKQIREVSPILLVRDVLAAHEYFSSKLGFRSHRMWGDPPMFCIPERDGLSVMLNQVGAGDEFRPNASYDGRFDVYFWVHDADALFAEFTANRADIVCEPSDEAYGMREFQVRDLDGHLLAFGHDISGAVSQ